MLHYLLRYGLERNNRDSWKHLYVLSEICYSVPRSKLVIADMIRVKYASKIGELLNKINDFQQANLLIELLSNCFPRKSTQEVGVVLPPTLWQPGNAMNDDFFNSPLYPFRGKHGDAQVTKFVWNICRSHMENLVRLSSVTYGSSSNGSGGKRLRVNEAQVGPHYCYIQALHGGIFLWDAEGMFLEMDRRRLNITRSSKGKIKIHFIGDSAKCLNSTSKLWLKMFSTAKWFQLDISDQRASDNFLYEITHVRKISEVQTFLTLNHTDEDTTESNEEVTSKTMQNLQYRPEEGLLGSSERQPESGCRIDKAEQLVTPEHSDAKIGTDEWDFNPSSEQQGTVLSNAQGTMQVTPKQSDDLISNSSHGEESPLVLAQKRRRIRETTKTLEMLKKGFTLTSNPPSSKGVEGTNAMRSPSLTITKFEPNSKVSEKNQEAEKIKTPKIKAVNSIGVKDISILSTIFGKPSGSSNHKRSKRQQRLKNFKPVIDVPSQDPPLIKKNAQRNERNVVTRSSAKVAGKEGLTGQAEGEINKTGEIGTNMPTGERDRASLAKKTELHSAKKDAENKSRKRKAEEKVDQPPSEQRKKIKRTDAAKIAQPKGDSLLSKVENIENPSLNNVSLLDSTTMLENLSYAGQAPLAISSGNSFTNRLNEQIFSSITLFSNEMIRKMAIINKELNHKIVKELSEKYQKLFQELQKSFQSDTEEMLNFMAEIKDMMNLSEDELTQVIRNREFGQYSRAAE